MNESGPACRGLSTPKKQKDTKKKKKRQISKHCDRDR